MKLLLDESVPWPLRGHFPGHEVFTTAYMGWKGKGNGELLALARDEFDVLITLDRNIPYQQRITEADVAVVVMIGKSNTVEDLMPLAARTMVALTTIRRGEIVSVSAE